MTAGPGWTKEADKLILQSAAVLQSALPYRQRFPPCRGQRLYCCSITKRSPLPFLGPKGAVGLRRMPSGGTAVQMPETAVDENNFAPGSENQVGLSREQFSAGGTVKAEPVAGCMKEPPYQKLRFGVLAPNPGHVPAALLSSGIGHESSLGKGGCCARREQLDAGAGVGIAE